jgi:protoheme IX farnesyltransferase
MTRLYRFALATVVGTLLLLALGGIARLQPAGAGCGNDWPLCRGRWLPPLEATAIVEYVHRLGAIAVFSLALATAILALRTPQSSRRIRLLAWAGVAIVFVQGLIGGATAVWGAPLNVALLHLTLAMIFLAGSMVTLAAIAAERAAPRRLAALGQWPSRIADRTFARVATLGAVLMLLLLVLGASTSATGALSCATWPLCVDGSAALHTWPDMNLGYRASALLGTLVTATVAVLAWRRVAAPLPRLLALTGLALVLVQSGLNALGSIMGDPAWTSAPHLVIAALLWLVMVGVALAAWGPAPRAAIAQTHTTLPVGSSGSSIPAVPVSTMSNSAMTLAAPAALDIRIPSAPVARLRGTLSDYVALTKPGIMTLLLTTTLCAMLMAARGVPPFWLVIATMIGGALASGGASVLNCYLDRDIDGQMSRTRNRAIVAGRVSPQAALIFGITLSVIAVLLLGVVVNWSAAALALAGNLFYVFVYTKWLKRSTPYNIVIGGAAGAAPPLVGWAAVTGDLSPLAWGLFAIIFAWTPPHFWALALLKQGEYTRASVPMLPVVRGEAETRRQIVIYTVLLALVCLALTPFGLGPIYVVGALLLNGIFLGYALWLYFQPSKRIARQMFFYSLWYLALIFAVAVADRAINL